MAPTASAGWRSTGRKALDRGRSRAWMGFRLCLWRCWWPTPTCVPRGIVMAVPSPGSARPISGYRPCRRIRAPEFAIDPQRSLTHQAHRPPGTSPDLIPARAASLILPSPHPTKGAVARRRAAGCGSGFRKPSPSRAGICGGEAGPRRKSPRAEPGGAGSASHRHLDIDTRHRHAAKLVRRPAPRIPFGIVRRNPAARGRTGLFVRAVAGRGEPFLGSPDLEKTRHSGAEPLCGLSGMTRRVKQGGFRRTRHAPQASISRTNGTTFSP